MNIKHRQYFNRTIPNDGFFKDYSLYWKKMFNAKGRSRRSELFHAFIGNIIINVIIIVAILCVYVLLCKSNGIDIVDSHELLDIPSAKLLLIPTSLFILFNVIQIFPTISIMIRRLHDIDKGAIWLLLCAIPGAGILFLIVYALSDSDDKENKYGKSKKYI